MKTVIDILKTKPRAGAVARSVVSSAVGFGAVIFIFFQHLAAGDTGRPGLDPGELKKANADWCERNAVTLREGNADEIISFRPKKLFLTSEFVIPRSEKCSTDTDVAKPLAGLGFTSKCRVCAHEQPINKEQRIVITGEKSIRDGDFKTEISSYNRSVSMNFSIIMTTPRDGKFVFHCDLPAAIPQKEFFCNTLPGLGIFFPDAPDLPKIPEKRVNRIGNPVI